MMDDNSGLPISSGPKDHLRLGFSSLEQEKNTHHSIEVLQSSSEVEWALKLDTIRRTYGSHMAMRLATEKAILSRSRRLPGLESSQIALETMMGTAESIDYKDFLNGKLFKII
jgi:proteasome maturation protein